MHTNRRHASDSFEQREGEAVILTLLQVELGCPLVEEVLPLGDGAVVKIDGINREHRILCEVYSRIGKLKGAQPDKLASDMLKLSLAERALGGAWRKLICLADPDAASCLLGKSWLAAAARRMDFEVRVCELPPAVRERILAAQRRQRMVNVNVD